MATHERFKFTSLSGFQETIARLGLDIPTTTNLAILATPTDIGPFRAPNRLAIHPMEGCDGERDGRPGPLTIRRYERFAAGGAGLLWVEACAVVPEGRANPRQLWLTRENLPEFRALVARMHEVARARMGADFCPVTVLQLTHSGRYSKPDGVPAPLIAHHSIIDAKSHVTEETPLLTDAYLDGLQDAYVQTALLAQEAGFDAVDIKACHRYLMSELLASFTRENSRYGGSYENRTRLMREVIEKIRAAAPDLEITTRLNLYDALDYPYGWGVNQASGEPDLTEPLQLIGWLVEHGMHALNATQGNPYYNPHFNRPYDLPIQGGYVPEEHPLESLQRFLTITRTVQQAFPTLTVLGSGYSWLREYLPNVAAAVLERGWAGMIGVGREAFAYPDFAYDLLTTGAMDRKKVCVACSRCTQMMRDSVVSGCAIRDADVYGPIYREGREGVGVSPGCNAEICTCKGTVVSVPQGCGTEPRSGDSH
ncbi:MAG TPA: NADH:flavin oxidoreductase [Armatimonadota bacterium]|jgi:2,4-dienoyl-CoA reductase-like NADH-dependent reductase (Old Yellow Enzyme family)